MKVRFKDNFIRYRLTRPEVRQLSESGVVEGRTNIPKDQVFRYRLESKEGIKELDVTFLEGLLTMFIPLADAKEWDTIKKVGYRTTKNVGDGQILVILLEKDFQCLDDTEEDQSENYPNPLSKTGL